MEELTSSYVNSSLNVTQQQSEKPVQTTFIRVDSPNRTNPSGSPYGKFKNPDLEAATAEIEAEF